MNRVAAIAFDQYKGKEICHIGSWYPWDQTFYFWFTREEWENQGSE